MTQKTTEFDTAATRALVSRFCDSEHRTAQTDELCVIVERACTEIDALREQLEPLKNGVERCRRGTLAELEALRERLKAAEAVCLAAGLLSEFYAAGYDIVSMDKKYIAAQHRALEAWRAVRGWGAPRGKP